MNYNKCIVRNEMVITPQQCRAARGLLEWSQGDLANKSGLTKLTVSAFERGGAMRTNNNALLEMAFEDGGVEFITENEASKSGGAGVRLKK